MGNYKVYMYRVYMSDSVEVDQEATVYRNIDSEDYVELVALAKRSIAKADDGFGYIINLDDENDNLVIGSEVLNDCAIDQLVEYCDSRGGADSHVYVSQSQDLGLAEGSDE